MSSNIPINVPDAVAPTPQNTPLVTAPIQTAGLSRPTVPDIQEAPELAIDDEDALVEDPLAHLSVEAKRSAVGLVGLQLKQTELQSQFKKEVWELERKVCTE